MSNAIKLQHIYNSTEIVQSEITLPKLFDFPTFRLFAYLMKVIPEMHRAALNSIFTFSLLTLGRYLFWWNIIPRGYHPPSSQYFGTDVVYYIFLLLKYTVPK